MLPVALLRAHAISCVSGVYKSVSSYSFALSSCSVGAYRINTYYRGTKRSYHLNTLMDSKLTKHGSFRFTDYDCIGFDLDNTICRYKVLNMVRLEYEVLAKFLVEERGYSPKYLLLPIENNIDFMLKGLILDINNGNVLRIDSNAYILHGSHGTRELSRTLLKEYYGEECRWQVTDSFAKDPLHTWNGPMSMEMRTLLDYFDMPAGLIFARTVDTLDEDNGNKPLPHYNVWVDIVDALTNMFRKDHFMLEKGGYFPEMKNNPDQYIHKCSDKLIDWFKELKRHNKCLFLITGSNVDFASHTAENSLGKNWKEHFDIVIFFAKKPGFFTENRQFIGLNGTEETLPVADDFLEAGKSYTYGNWKGLHNFLKKQSKNEDPKIVYIGDNLVQDVYTPAVHAQCDTVAICEELEAEGAYGHEQSHTEKHLLTSNIWGSYFHHQDWNTPTIWKEFIRNHAKICIPNLEYVANFPVDHSFIETDQ